MSQDEIERLLERLKETVNRVPDRVRNGGVMETRSWIRERDEAAKLLKKRNVTATEVLSALNRLQ